MIKYHVVVSCYNKLWNCYVNCQLSCSNSAMNYSQLMSAVIFGMCSLQTLCSPILVIKRKPGVVPSVQAVSQQVTLVISGDRLPLLSARPRSPSQPKERHGPLALPSYTAWWPRHIDVNGCSTASGENRTHDLMITTYSWLILKAITITESRVKSVRCQWTDGRCWRVS